MLLSYFVLRTSKNQKETQTTREQKFERKCKLHGEQNSKKAMQTSKVRNAKKRLDVNHGERNLDESA